MAGPSGASYRMTKSDVQAGIGNPVSHKDAEGAKEVPPGSDPGRGRAAERGDYILLGQFPLSDAYMSFLFVDFVDYRYSAPKFNGRWNE